MKKYLIYGIGENYQKCKDYFKGKVVGYIDKNHQDDLMEDGLPVYDISQITSLNFDVCLITSTKYFNEIYKEATKYIDPKKIISFDELDFKQMFFDSYSDIVERFKNSSPKVNQKDYKNIYIVAPAGYHSGGPELLHQLCFQLNQMKKHCVMAYTNTSAVEKNAWTYAEYLSYVQYPSIDVKQIEDDSGNIVVIPETYAYLIKFFKHARVFFWWMSVDNFLNTVHKDDIQYIYTNVYLHLYQSEYANEFLKLLHLENKLPLSDYLSDSYQNSDLRQDERKNIVLYNPSKGISFTKKIVDYARDITFVPLQGLSKLEMKTVLKTSKVYIDFGNHPGKDRIPREAALNGCCIITNRKGAAQNNIDIPIPEHFKFENNDELIPQIVQCIRFCFENYDNVQNEFCQYINEIQSEKRKFTDEIEQIFT